MATSAARAVRLAGLRVDPVDRLRVPAEQLVERTLGDQPAAIQDPDPVADPLDVGQDVGREDDRRAGPQVGDERQQVAPALGIERADRLVEDQQARRGDERLGDPEPLAHPARVAADPPARRVGEPDQLEASRPRASATSASVRPCSRPASSTSSRPVIQP